MLPDYQAMTREEELVKEGWRKQFMTNEPRLSEAVEEYKAIGFEVRLEAVDLNEDDGTCKACLKFAPDEFKVIYTRKPPHSHDDEDPF